MSYNLSNRSKKRLAGVHPDIVKIVFAAIADSPFDFGVPRDGGLRTVEDQQRLYSKGRTDGGSRPVTYVDGVRKKSNHQEREDGYGYAFDIYIYDHETKRASWNVDKLRAVAEHILAYAQERGIELEWGGNWTRFKDYPHFQIKKGVLL